MQASREALEDAKIKHLTSLGFLVGLREGGGVHFNERYVAYRDKECTQEVKLTQDGDVDEK